MPIVHMYVGRWETFMLDLVSKLVRVPAKGKLT